MNDIPLHERIIFALDVADVGEAKRLVDLLRGEIGFFKVGLQLFLAGWWEVIDYVAERGGKVMVDLKFFDIPETVALAVEQLQGHSVTFATIHGNDPIIRAAVARKKGEMKLLAVTVLTSFDESDMRQMGMSGTIADLVLLRAKKAIALGCDGVVSSGLEAKALRGAATSDFIIVTPGIRPGKNIDEIGGDDQKRVATAREAIKNGADYVVIGRPIKNAADPVAMAKSVKAEIAQALAEK
ncbi:MAG: orotidine-5'-phosphate decarboxylase [Desulfobulbaceae bacterium]|jgi:orotidine-5'-phosphate decarboxylase|nr:orotidine-5'-phosphate decarboxylase [Desulfobulbaceae bacterium]